MSLLTKVIVLDVLSILCYMVWCTVYGYVWYEYILCIIGMLAIGNAILVRSKIVCGIGIVTICIAICVLM